MTALFTPRIRAARGLIALAAIAICALAAAAGPAAADGTAKSAHRAAGKTITLRYYVETIGFVYRRADGSVLPQPPATAAVGDQLEITELGYKGTHKSHAKKWSTSSYTVCHFKSAKGAPTCEGVLAIGGNQVLIFRTEPEGDPAVIGGTGRYVGATGGVKSTEIPDTNNSDAVLTVNLKK
jgi:hypothetical protein